MKSTRFVAVTRAAGVLVALGLMVALVTPFAGAASGTAKVRIEDSSTARMARVTTGGSLQTTTTAGGTSFSQWGTTDNTGSTELASAGAGKRFYISSLIFAGSGNGEEQVRVRVVQPSTTDCTGAATVRDEVTAVIVPDGDTVVVTFPTPLRTNSGTAKICLIAFAYLADAGSEVAVTASGWVA